MIYTALRPGGRLVVEFGGKGNVETIVHAIEIELDGTDEIRNWLAMFCESLLEPVPDENRDAVIDAIEQRLRSELYYDESWHADYRRLRIVAHTVGHTP